MSTSTISATALAVRAGTYDVDPVHSRIAFAVKHLGITIVRGSFGRFAATIEVGDDFKGLIVAATIEAGSVDTGFLARDEHLRTPDFFDVERHPALSFTSLSASPVDQGRFRVVGDLTLRGVTRPIVLEARVGGIALDQHGNQRLGLTAKGRLRRSDFGLPFDQAPGGVALVADNVELVLDVEAIRRP